MGGGSVLYISSPFMTMIPDWLHCVVEKAITSANDLGFSLTLLPSFHQITTLRYAGGRDRQIFI